MTLGPSKGRGQRKRDQPRTPGPFKRARTRACGQGHESRNGSFSEACGFVGRFVWLFSFTGSCYLIVWSIVLFLTASGGDGEWSTVFDTIPILCPCVFHYRALKAVPHLDKVLCIRGSASFWRLVYLAFGIWTPDMLLLYNPTRDARVTPSEETRAEEEAPDEQDTPLDISFEGTGLLNQDDSLVQIVASQRGFFWLLVPFGSPLSISTIYLNASFIVYQSSDQSSHKHGNARFIGYVLHLVSGVAFLSVLLLGLCPSTLTVHGLLYTEALRTVVLFVVRSHKEPVNDSQEAQEDGLPSRRPDSETTEPSGKYHIEQATKHLDAKQSKPERKAGAQTHGGGGKSKLTMERGGLVLNNKRRANKR